MDKEFTGSPVLCGSTPLLGSWDSKKGLKPDPEVGPNADPQLRTWTFHVPKDQMETSFEFKLVDLANSKWQTGPNTAVPLSQRGFVTMVDVNDGNPVSFK